MNDKTQGYICTILATIGYSIYSGDGLPTILASSILFVSVGLNIRAYHVLFIKTKGGIQNG